MDKKFLAICILLTLALASPLLAASTCPTYCTKCTNEKLCYGCGPNYYLAGNSWCLEIKKKVTNCELYISDNQCLECEEGYGLTDNVCVKCADTNCVTC